jgi:hypothetical protein
MLPLVKAIASGVNLDMMYQFGGWLRRDFLLRSSSDGRLPGFIAGRFRW